MRCLFACLSSSKQGRHRRLVKPTNSVDQSPDACKALLAAESTNQEHGEKPVEAAGKLEKKLEEPETRSAENKVTIDMVLKTIDELPDEGLKNDLIQENEKGNEKKDAKPFESEFSFHSNCSYQNCPDVGNAFGDSRFVQSKLVNNDGERADDNGFVIQESSESLFSLSIGSRKQSCDVELCAEKEVTSPIMPNCSDSHVDATKLMNVSDKKSLDRNCSDNSVETHTQHEEKVMKDSFALEQEKEKFVFSDNVLGPSIEEPVTTLSMQDSGTNSDHKKELGCQAVAVGMTETQHEEKSMKDACFQDQEKENIVFSDNVLGPIEEPVAKLAARNSKAAPAQKKKLDDQEIAIDASLSSWLLHSEEMAFQEANSIDSNKNLPSKIQTLSTSQEGRMVLGILKPPVRAASLSPDEVPVIGTIGSYLSRTRHSRTLIQDSL